YVTSARDSESILDSVCSAAAVPVCILRLGAVAVVCSASAVVAVQVGDLESMTLQEWILFFFFQAEDGIRDWSVTGVQTCALPISLWTCSRLARPLIATMSVMAPPLPRPTAPCSRSARPFGPRVSRCAPAGARGARGEDRKSVV